MTMPDVVPGDTTWRIVVQGVSDPPDIRIEDAQSLTVAILMAHREDALHVAEVRPLPPGLYRIAVSAGVRRITGLVLVIGEEPESGDADTGGVRPGRTG
ncbi:hypothetical protein ACF09Z_12190 [Streptomyces erythrochromogenes]|uniref:hypothetical protein n=1 Tax=Streptomyces erythrochromogenes TaxID=285574 RepID=UPI0036F5E514